jgi:hypothetical protein
MSRQNALDAREEIAAVYRVPPPLLGLPAAVFDCRGARIEPGVTVVTAVGSGLLAERVVRDVDLIEREGAPGWVRVRFTNGGHSTPDRVAVVEPAGAAEALRKVRQTLGAVTFRDRKAEAHAVTLAHEYAAAWLNANGRR